MKRLIFILLLTAVFTSGCSSQEQSYDISGMITNEAAEGIENVRIKSETGDSIKSDQEGNWSKVDISDEVVITPVKEGYEFNPPQKEIDSPRQNINFEAIEKDYFAQQEIYAVDIGGGRRVLFEEIIEGEEYKIAVDARTLVENSELNKYLEILNLQHIDLAVVNNPYPGQIKEIIDKIENFDLDEVIDPALENTIEYLEDYLAELKDENIDLFEDRLGLIKELADEVNILDLFK